MAWLPFQKCQFCFLDKTEISLEELSIFCANREYQITAAHTSVCNKDFKSSLLVSTQIAQPMIFFLQFFVSQQAWFQSKLAQKQIKLNSKLWATNFKRHNLNGLNLVTVHVKKCKSRVDKPKSGNYITGRLLKVLWKQNIELPYTFEY